MAEAIFITPAELVKNTPIGGNVDQDRYTFLIYEKQRFLIEDILGSALYEKIANDILAGTPLTGHYLKIHTEYLKPILYSAVFAEYVLMGQYNVQDSGIFKSTPANSESAPVDEIRFLASNYEARADVWIDRLDKYLCDKSSEIPEYRDSQPNDYDQKPIRDVNMVGGWFLPETRAKKWYYEDI